MASSSPSLPVTFSIMGVILALLSSAEAKEIPVGGKHGSWQAPSSESDSLNSWAQRARFQVGDFLVWNYDGAKDSVLQVTKEAYSSCNTSEPIAAFNDGHTKLKLDRPGPFYFISGAKGHCNQGQKMVVVVMTPRNRFFGASPAPSPAEFQGPAFAPTSSAIGGIGSSSGSKLVRRVLVGLVVMLLATGLF